LAAAGLSIALNIDMSGQAFGLSAPLTLAVYLTAASLLLQVLVRLVAARGDAGRSF
jgi:hypothetical protein